MEVIMVLLCLTNPGYHGKLGFLFNNVAAKTRIIITFIHELKLNHIWAGAIHLSTWFFIDVLTLDEQNVINMGDFSSNSIANVLTFSCRLYIQLLVTMVTKS